MLVLGLEGGADDPGGCVVDERTERAQVGDLVGHAFGRHVPPHEHRLGALGAQLVGRRLGSAVLAIDKGSFATFSFSGTGAKWIGFRDAYSGIANVYVDGVLKTQVDGYAATDQAQCRRDPSQGCRRASRLFTEGAELVTLAGTYVGPDAIAGFYRDLAFTVDDLWPEPGPLLIDDDHVAVEIRLRMNGNVSLVADFFTLTDQKISRLAIYSGPPPGNAAR